MGNMNNTDQINKIKIEMDMLYEISNAVFSTLKLDEILYIILTCVTSKKGLGFDRAMLFMANTTQTALEGRMGIGPKTGAEGRKLWESIRNKSRELKDFIQAYEHLQEKKDWGFNKTVRALKLPITDSDDIISMTFLEAMSFEVTTELQRSKLNKNLRDNLKLENFVCVPLKGRRKTLGVILVDNSITKKLISPDEIKMLMMFLGLAALAVENSQLYEKMLDKSNTDSLTGLHNHGHFQYMLSQEIKKINLTQKPVSLLMLDIDYFKNYNDTLGHPAGDKLLGTLSKMLKKYFRATDIVCRYGGEEFSIILPGAAQEKAAKFAEKLRRHIEAYEFQGQDIQPHHNLTVSIGVCGYPENAENKGELIYRADMALYQAKRGGRNRIRAYRS